MLFIETVTIYIHMCTVCLLQTLFLCNHLLLSHVVQTFTTRGKLQPIQSHTFVSQLPMSYLSLLTPGENIYGTSLPVSHLEQGGAVRH